MIDLTSQEWSGSIGTGLFGTAYGLGAGRSLVLVGAPGSAVGAEPERTWPWIIMKGRVRDFAFAEGLLANEDLAARTGVQVIASDRLFTAQEKDLGDVFRILREAVQAAANRRPDRKAAR